MQPASTPSAEMTQVWDGSKPSRKRWRTRTASYRPRRSRSARSTTARSSARGSRSAGVAGRSRQGIMSRTLGLGIPAGRGRVGVGEHKCERDGMKPTEFVKVNAQFWGEHLREISGHLPVSHRRELAGPLLYPRMLVLTETPDWNIVELV